MRDVIQQSSSLIICDVIDTAEVDRVIKFFSVYDERYHRYDTVACHYNEKLKQLRIPDIHLGILQDMIGEFKLVTSYPNKFKSLSTPVSMVNTPRDSDQINAISFASAIQNYSYIRNHSRRCLNLATGIGKTYCAISSIYFSQAKTAIISKTGILKVWYPELLKHSSIIDDHVLLVCGMKIMDALYAGELESDIYLFSHSTIRNWCKVNGWDSLNELFVKLGIYMNVFDEYHREFSNIMKINFYTNVNVNLYLSASSKKGDWKLDKVFQRAFKLAPHFTKEITGDDRHVTSILVNYNSNPTSRDKLVINSVRGINKALHGKYLGEKTILTDIICHYLNKLIKNNKRIVIFLGSLPAIINVKSLLEKVYPELSIGDYSSNTSLHKEEQLNCDVILSTYGSMGEGKNVENLYYVLDFECSSNPETYKQMMGRLRNKEGSIMLRFFDRGFPSVANQYKRVLPVIRKLSSKVLECDWNDNV